MRLSAISALSSILFKSYFRAGRPGGLGRFMQLKIMILIDAIVFAAPFMLLQFLLPLFPEDLLTLVKPLAWQTLVGLPLLLTSGIIVAGILFELGQGSGVSSSEAVNWLPISPREYVAASTVSVVSAYSFLLAFGVGIALPLALQFDLIRVWPVTVIFSLLALILGALIIEILRAAVNRVSSTVYRRSGKFAIISRLVLVVILFVVIQMAFSPYILFNVLSILVGGVELAWFVPMVWPSVAITNLIQLNLPAVATFSALSFIFVFTIFFSASYLRQRYWSPSPVSIVIESSTKYAARTPSILGLAFTPQEAAIALKEFRALVRRRDLARFIAIPILFVISMTAPTLFSPSDYAGRSPGFFLMAMIPYITTLMLASITIGQEGKAVVNLRMLPIKAGSLIKGKLLPTWLISIVATLAITIIFQTVDPMPLPIIAATIIASMLVVEIESFIGLGIAVRYPDFTIGTRSRYITFKGFIIGFIIGGIFALATFVPIGLTIISTGGIRGPAPPFTFDLTIALPISILIGTVLSYLSYRYCKHGVEKFLTNLEA
ncbi:MAG: hypothetical protein M1503_12165 [Thaumarchaeota archaeon]|nr:hypothetical protein [Nitrososphaerota archaeon]MCL5318996.1 hypothetical protein [Nitrososphaerota archaeon]